MFWVPSKVKVREIMYRCGFNFGFREVHGQSNPVSILFPIPPAKDFLLLTVTCYASQ